MAKEIKTLMIAIEIMSSTSVNALKLAMQRLLLHTVYF